VSCIAPASRLSALTASPPAIAFTYFEALLRVGDVNKLGDEEARLNSMGNLMEHAGYARDIWTDFADEAFELLRKLGDSLQLMDGAAADILLSTFNDMGASMAIITYFKVSPSSPRLIVTLPDSSSSLLVRGCRRMQTTSGTSFPWATSRHTVQTTLSLHSVKPTTSESPLSLTPSSSLPALVSRSGILTAHRVKRSTAASSPSQQTTIRRPSRTRQC
jgi:hypothetical protein